MRTIADSFREEGRIEGFKTSFVEGFIQGFIEGFNLGRAKGRQEAVADIIIEDLEEHFGELPQNLVERIRSLPGLSTLKAMRRALRKADSIEDCARLIARNDWN